MNRSERIALNFMNGMLNHATYTINKFINDNGCGEQLQQYAINDILVVGTILDALHGAVNFEVGLIKEIKDSADKN